jgi:hypothetical protein
MKTKKYYRCLDQCDGQTEVIYNNEKYVTDDTVMQTVDDLVDVVTIIKHDENTISYKEIKDIDKELNYKENIYGEPREFISVYTTSLENISKRCLKCINNMKSNDVKPSNKKCKYYSNRFFDCDGNGLNDMD